MIYNVVLFNLWPQKL